jgi:hypothetical protein
MRSSVRAVISYSLLAAAVAGLIATFRDQIYPRTQAQPQFIVIRPPLNAGSGSGDFTWLDNAIDTSETTGSVGQLSVACSSTCDTELTRVSVWRNFPDGFIPAALEVRWDVVGYLTLAAGHHSRVILKLEIDIGSGWQVVEQETWTDAILTCPTSPLACSGHVFTEALAGTESTGVMKVRATVKAKMTTCSGCGWGDFSNLTVQSVIRDVRVQAKTPTLTVTPNPVTRGDSATFEVKGAPGGTISNWQYQTTDPAVGTIGRSVDEASATWPGQIVAGGKVTVQVVLLGQTYNLPSPGPLELSVTPRTWQSQAVQPEHVSPGTPDACGTLSPNVPGVCPGTGIGRSSLCMTWDPPDVAQVDTGPNEGLWWVRTLNDLTTYKWAIHGDVENPNSDFCQHQCGNWAPAQGSTCPTPAGAGFVSCGSLAGAIERHEANTQGNSHWANYAAAVPVSQYNLLATAEPVIGKPDRTEAQFRQTVNGALLSPQNQLGVLAAAEPIPCTMCTPDCTQSVGPINCRSAQTDLWIQPSCAAPASIAAFASERAAGRVKVKENDK